MSHHGREVEENKELALDYADACTRNHTLRHVIRCYLEGVHNFDDLRRFAVQHNIIPDPDAAIKLADSKIRKLEKELKLAKEEWTAAMNTRKCKTDE
jgi:hypothetical protein